eukprot:12319670-Alexandrium_andersonii.AAC.1
MSASLVGSEMCIRDRLNFASVAGADDDELEAVGLGHPIPHPAPGGQELPVSYTHLTLPTICSV